MCLDPGTLALISAGISGTSAVVGYEAQRRAAASQAEAIRQEQALRQNDLARQRAQIDAQARQQMNEASKAALKDLALFETLAGEYGGGKTTQRAISIADVQRGDQLATIATNRDNAQVENSFQSLATKTAAEGRMAQIQQPSLFETALRIGGAAVTYGTRMNELKRPSRGQ